MSVGLHYLRFSRHPRAGAPILRTIRNHCVSCEVIQVSPPLVWFEAVGQHGDKLQGFYTELLGWRFDSPGPPPKRGAVRVARASRPARAAAEPPWWVTFYTPVPDLDAAIRRARALGSRLLVAPTQHGDNVIAVVSDPEGHPVGLCAAPRG